MPIDSKFIPPHYLKLMAKEDRKKLGRCARTEAEITAEFHVKLERELHRLIEQELRRRNIYFLTSRMDKKPTIRVGAADFIVILPGERCLMLEVKLPGEEFRPEQIDNARDYMNQTGGIVHPVYSLADVIRLLPPEV